MFHDISAGMREVMQTMEEQLARDQRSLRSVDTDVARVLSGEAPVYPVKVAN